MRRTKNDDTGTDDELDALFTHPLSEFTAARNALVRRLKQANRVGDSERVQALAKPAISAWAVNQLYWKHRDEFDLLLAAGARLGQAHTLQMTGKAADVHAPLAARREALSVLLHLADKLLRDAGHSSSPDIMRRIATTIETASTSASDASLLGRLTDDIGPLGFESMAALVPGAGFERAGPAVKTRKDNGKTLASTRAALKAAEQALRKNRTAAQNIAKKLKDATARAKAKEKDQRQSEERLAKAKIAAEEALRRVRDVTSEAEMAVRALQEAEQAIERAQTELEQMEKTNR